MTLTMPIFLTLVGIASFAFILMAVFLYLKKWGKAAICYLNVGLFAFGITFKIAMPAVSFLGVLFLTIIWPVWLGQSMFGYHVTAWFPDWFWTYIFNVG